MLPPLASTRARAALATGAALALAAACGDRREAPAPASTPGSAAGSAAGPAAPSAGADAGFVIARPAVRPGALPARFTGPLPATVAELAGAPPPRFVENALFDDAHDMRARLTAGLARAAAAGAIPDEVRQWYLGVLGFAPPPAFCAWLGAYATSAAPAAARAIAWRGLADCTDPALEALYLRDDAPDAAIVAHAASLRAGALPFHPRLARAAAAEARAATHISELYPIGRVFGVMQGEATLAAFDALARTLPADRAARAAVALADHPLPGGRARGLRGCRHPANANLGVCADVLAAPAGAADVGVVASQLPQLVRDAEESTATLVARHGRPAVVAAATACVREAHERWEAPRCLARLAALDRAAALAAAQARWPAAAPASVQVELATLRAFPAAGALEAELARLGFALATDARPIDPLATPALTAAQLLEAADRALTFDTETGQFPNEHDALLARLAQLVRPALAGVVFEEVAPPEAAMDTGPYELRAYADGQRFTLAAANHGDWYDVEAVLGLLNALLVARGSDLRLDALATGDQTLTVVAGPRAGLRALAARGLLARTPAAAPMQDGKAGEARMIEELRRQGASDLRRAEPLGDVQYRAP